MSPVNVNPGGTSGNSDRSAAAGMSLGLIIGLILVLVLLLAAYYFLWPLLAGTPQPPSVNVNVRTSGLTDALALFA